MSDLGIDCIYCGERLTTAEHKCKEKIYPKETWDIGYRKSVKDMRDVAIVAIISSTLGEVYADHVCSEDAAMALIKIKAEELLKEL